MRAVRKLTVVQFKLYLREPAAFFFTLVFPAMVLLLFGAIFGNESYGGVRYVDYETPALVAMVIGTVGLMSIPIATAVAREHHILRRYFATPLRPVQYIIADLAANIAVSLLGSLLLIVVGWLVYDLHLPDRVLAWILAFLLAMLSFAAAGYLIAALAPTTRVAQTVGMVLFYPMLFLSGAAFPLEIMPAWLQELSKLLPLRYVVTLLQGLWFGDGWREHLTDVTVLTAILVGATLLSVRTFRWE